MRVKRPTHLPQKDERPDRRPMLRKDQETDWHVEAREAMKGNRNEPPKIS